eukprot:TRINITY_DN5594_c0_g1_i9.p1 TRINITY_DN5594_c0_g1~~TRINITY_DN5594_c0_g1_i9.p1  ORF type:complete len:318 (+),score=42.65 TRINITY_DN5594_c0_g1_i9:356-1309(+)
MLKHIVIAFGVASWTVLFYGIFVVIEPWTTGQQALSPQYVIPILGMILGNTLDGVSLGLRNTLKELTDGSDRIEFMLAMGATRWEALRPVLIEVLQLAMTPLLNRLSIVGLVSIPGMMTGQILGGSSPFLAAKYQIVIMFLIATSYSTSTLMVSLFAMYHTIDSNHMLRLDLLKKRQETGSISAWMVKQVGTVYNKTVEISKRAYTSFTTRSRPQNGWQREGPSWLFPRKGERVSRDTPLQDEMDKLPQEQSRGQHEITMFSDEESYAGSLIHSEAEADAAPLLNQASGELQQLQPGSFGRRWGDDSDPQSSTSNRQ